MNQLQKNLNRHTLRAINVLYFMFWFDIKLKSLSGNLIQKLGSNLVRYKTKYFAWV